MSILEKLHVVIILIAVVIGLLLGQINIIEANAERFIFPFLFFTLYGLFLAIPTKDIRAAFKNFRFAGTSLTINYMDSSLRLGVRCNIPVRSAGIMDRIHNADGYSMHGLVSYLPV